MKLREMAVAIIATALAGCWCTTISDRYSIDGHSVDDPGENKTLRHKQYETVSAMNSLLEYSPDFIPAVITNKYATEMKLGSGALHRFVWLCTLGFFPSWDTYEYSWQIEIKTPVGEKTGVCTRSCIALVGRIAYKLYPLIHTSPAVVTKSVQTTQAITVPLHSIRIAFFFPVSCCGTNRAGITPHSMAASVISGLTA